jgi:hypothetical protein
MIFCAPPCKGTVFSGCESRPATFVLAGSNWSSRGGTQTAEASGVEGHISDLASMQTVDNAVMALETTRRMMGQLKLTVNE